MSKDVSEMSYTIADDLSILARMALRVREAADEGDDEKAHSREDALREAALVAVQRHAMRPDVAKIASIAMSTKDLDFARWCA